MELFTHDMDPKGFQQTNQIWNRMGLNAKWSIGVMTELIQQKTFPTKEDWMNYYYESGRKRLSQIQLLSPQDQAIVLSPKRPRGAREELVQLNTHYGRTPEELNEKGEALYQAMCARGFNVTLDLCQQAVHYRVIGETWNGIMGREFEAISWLEHQLNSLGINEGSCLKTTGEIDYEYAVDFELYIKERRIAGIQVKPDSYRGYTPYLNEAKRINLMKNKKYFDVFQAPVIYIYTTSSGVVTNQSEVNQALKYLI